MTKATIHSNGLVIWKPPAIYKSLCPINVEFFPFDEQMCTLKIGSWTYDGYSVDIKHISLPCDASEFDVIEKGIFTLTYLLTTKIKHETVNTESRQCRFNHGSNRPLARAPKLRGPPDASMHVCFRYTAHGLYK